MPPNASMNRRQFLHTTALAAAAGTFLPLRTLPAAEKPPGRELADRLFQPALARGQDQDGATTRRWMGSKPRATS